LTFLASCILDSVGIRISDSTKQYYSTGFEAL
jgi:hypothetical protein